MTCPICRCPEQRKLFSMTDRLGLVPGQFHVFECAGCGGQFLDPMPDPDLKDPYFEQYWGEKNKGLGPLARLELAYKRMLDKLELSRLRPRLPAGARVVDIGCGDGDALAILHEWGYECWGLDTSPAGVEAVRGRLPIETRLGSVLNHDLEAGSFDLARMSHVMEHIPDPARAAAEVCRLLKPGGLACIIVPNAASLEQRLTGRHWFPYFPPRHVIFFTPGSLSRLLENAGLEVEDVSYPWLLGATFNSSVAPFLNYFRSQGKQGLGGLVFRLANAALAVATIPLSIVGGLLRRGPSVMVLARKPK